MKGDFVDENKWKPATKKQKKTGDGYSTKMAQNQNFVEETHRAAGVFLELISPVRR